MAMIFFAICAIAAVICFVFGIYRSVELVKNPQETVDFKLYFKRVIPLILGFTVAFTAMLIWIYPWAKISPKPYEAIQAVIGGIIFSSSTAIATNGFIVHYYRKNIPELLNKWLFRIMMLAFFMVAIFFFVTTNGYADYLTYPLVNAISFSEGFVTPGHSGNIAFYALFILSGAIGVYLLCDHKMYIEYGKHGLLESVFLIAFPAGIIGARIFYVIGNFNVPVADGGFGGVFDANVFAIWNGGLTILGGAIVGIVVGVSWLMWRRKECNIWLLADIIIPTILIAQAVGRWGNFFNLEVHGLESNEAYWNWLPRIVFNNMHYSTSTGAVSVSSSGTIFVPLFFIEGLVNLFGFGLLAHVFGKRLRNATELGDIGIGYIIWYGLTRVLLEPLRDPAYNMGEDGYWSWIWGMAFVVVGVLLILANHIVRDVIRNKKNENIARKDNEKKYFTIFSILLGVALIGIIISVILMSIGTFTGKIAYSKFNLGLIGMDLAISFLVVSSIPCYKWLYLRRNKSNA